MRKFKIPAERLEYLKEWIKKNPLVIPENAEQLEKENPVMAGPIKEVKHVD